MPDVGTLNLTIESNANVAASGLDKLADALSRVQQAVGTGLKLSNASRSINSFAKAVSENSKALSNVGTFLTAITNYTKAFKDAEKVKFNAKPIEDLKNAIGEGIKIGQAGTQINKLREALGGDWNIDNAKKAGDAMTLIADGAKTFVGTNLGTIAKNVSAVGKALAEYADGAERIKSVIGNQSTSSSDIIGNSGFAPGRMKLNLQQFGEGGSGDGSFDIKNFTSKQSEIQSAVSAYGEIADQFTKVNETVQTALNDDPILRMSFSIGNIGQSAQTTVPLIDLLQKDLEKLEQKAAKIAERFAGFGGDPMNSEAFRSAEKRIISLTEKIENLTALNPNATKPESNGIASITKGLVDTSDLDLWKNKIEAHIDDVVARYNKGKLSVEQFNAEIMKIRKDQGKFLEVSAQAKAAEIVASKMEELSNATGDSVSKVELLGKKLAWLRQQLEERKLVTQFLGIDQNTDQKLLSLQGQIVSVTSQMEKLEAAEKKVKEAAQFDAMKESADNLQRSYGGEMVSNLVENYSQIDLLQLKLSGMKQALTDDINQNKLDTQQITERVMAIQSLTEKIKDLQDAEESATSWTQRFRDSFSELKDGVKKLFPSITNLLKRFQSIAKMRALRYVIREIAKGFSEGMKNLYFYSKEVGTSFAPAMDSAATALMQMKNSIGAALAPAIQAVIPLLKQVVSWFITGINYVNQFFALIRGQSSWTEAIEYSTEAYEDNTNAAQGAAKAAKDLLADWDELNIIQSESGGGGGGKTKKDQPEYGSMFQEVYTYNDKIREMVDWIKDNFDTIKSIAKKIGAAILGWKLSKAFKGLIGTLGSWIAAGALIDLEFQISTLLNNKFFDTGDEGWLIADVLTALIGGKLLESVLGNVLGGQYAYLGIPIMLTVNALARTKVLLGRSDVGALSKEALEANTVSALEFGGVAGYLAYTAGATIGEAIGGGAVATLITFGVLTNLKAFVEAAQQQEVTEDTIIAEALGAISIGAGLGIAAKLFVPEVTGAQALGFGVATGAAAFLFTMAATVGVVATTKAAKSGITEDIIWDDVKSSLMMGIGEALTVKMLTGTSWTIASVAGVGGALITMGAWIGIQAACRAAETKEITVDTVKNEAIASLLMGTGLAISEGVLFAETAGAAMLAGGLGAIAAFAALIAISAILAAQPAEIEWGDKKFTDAEIQNFIDRETFTFDVAAYMELSASAVEMSSKREAEFKNKVRQLTPLVDALVLGVDVEESAKKIDELVHAEDGVIAKFKELNAARQEQLTIAFSSVKIVDDTGSEQNKDLASLFSDGFTTMDKVMENLGKKLSKALKDSYDKSITGDAHEMAVQTVKAMTEAMAEVEAINRTHETAISLRNTFQEGLGKVDQGSMKALLDYYTQQQGTAREFAEGQYQQLMDEAELQWKNYTWLAEKAKEEGGEFAGFTYEDYIGMAKDYENALERMKKFREASVEKTIEFYQEGGEGYQMMREAMLNLTSGRTFTADKGVFGSEEYIESLSEMFAGSESVLLGDKGKLNVQSMLTNLIKQSFAESDRATIESALQSGVLKYSDFLNDSIINTLANNLGIGGASKEIQDKWNEYVNEILGTTGENKYEFKPFKVAQEETAESGFDEMFTISEEGIQSLVNFTNTAIDETKRYAKEAKEEIDSLTGGNWAPSYQGGAMGAVPISSNYTGKADEAKKEMQDLFSELSQLIGESKIKDKSGYFEKVNELFASGNIEEMKRLIEYIMTSGLEDGFEKFKQDTEAQNKGANNTLEWVKQNGGYTVASMGRADVDFSRGETTTTEQKTEPVVDYNQMANSVQQGTTMANNPMVSQLGSIIDQLTRLLNKQWVVNVEPTTTFGRTVNQSQTAYGNVTGDAPIFG